MSSTKIEPLAEVAEILGYYVYMLVDPRDGRPFYIGKGKGERVNSHAIEALAELERTSPDLSKVAEVDGQEGNRKIEKIAKLLQEGMRPDVWIARYGMTRTEYTAVEGALIDAFLSFEVSESSDRMPLGGVGKLLTNKRRENSQGHGMVRLKTLIEEKSAPPLSTQAPLVLIRLGAWSDREEATPGGQMRAGNGFRDEWFDRKKLDLDELSLATCSWWVINKESVRQQGIKHAVAVYRGVTRGLFEIVPDSWEASGTRNKRNGFIGKPVESGPLWDEVIGENGHRVGGMAKGSQNPIRYWPLR